MRVILAVAVSLLASSAFAGGSAPLRPDPSLTPGANDPSVLSSVPFATLCTPGYTAQKGVRNVSTATKKAVFAEYHIDPKGPGAPFEIDHLCSLELGCTNSQKNLWPESYATKPLNAHIKDALENRIHALVCKGQVPLAQAQHDISTDWVAAYVKYIGPLPQ
jgi:hypothetical protein